MMHIMLDMDGVIVEFMGGLHKRVKMPFSIKAYPYELGKYEMLGDVSNSMGLSLEEMFKITSHRDFWANLPWTKHGKSLVHLLKQRVGKDNIFICTSPMPKGDAWAGKVDWINKNIPFLNRHLIISSAPKYLLAKSDTMLIDDKDKNIIEFVQEGGDGFLVPAPWNSKYESCNKKWLPELDRKLC